MRARFALTHAAARARGLQRGHEEEAGAAGEARESRRRRRHHREEFAPGRDVGGVVPAICVTRTKVRRTCAPGTSTRDPSLTAGSEGGCVGDGNREMRGIRSRRIVRGGLNHREACGSGGFGGMVVEFTAECFIAVLGRTIFCDCATRQKRTTRVFFVKIQIYVVILYVQAILFPMRESQMMSILHPSGRTTRTV